jgi:16S rRNA pseudouridine516 synthase
VTSPRRRCNKTYLAGLKHPLADDVAQRFAAGLQLNGEAEATLPAQLQVLDPHTARVTLHEGRYHQVKRMFAACSNRVVTLHRERIGTIQLDPALAPGQWRELDHNEIRSFLHD